MKNYKEATMVFSVKSTQFNSIKNCKKLFINQRDLQGSSTKSTDVRRWRGSKFLNTLENLAEKLVEVDITLTSNNFTI